MRKHWTVLLRGYGLHGLLLVPNGQFGLWPGHAAAAVSKLFDELYLGFGLEEHSATPPSGEPLNPPCISSIA